MVIIDEINYTQLVPQEAIINTNTPFSDFGLDTKLLAALSTAGWETASPIQELTIEPILDGKDIFAQAETGSGKTGSFAIPIMEIHLRADSPAAEANLPQWLGPTNRFSFYKTWKRNWHEHCLCDWWREY